MANMASDSQVDPETRKALMEARELIRQREGKKAALILHKIDHPVAREWERKINQAVDWNRQPDKTKFPERGPMPVYLVALLAFPVLASAGFWFVAVGARIEAFLLLCILALVWGRIPRRAPQSAAQDINQA